MKTNEHNAFTLIELLVVIAIIGILSSVVLASLSGARESARDTQRVQDFEQIRTAINMYQNDNNGNFPGTGDTNHQISSNCTGTQLYQDLVGGGYLPSMPTDPIENFQDCNATSNATGNDFVYTFDYTNSGGDYCVAINQFETNNDGGSLSNINHSDRGGWGGGGNLDDAEFVHCFDGTTY